MVSTPWCATTSDYDVDKKWGFCAANINNTDTNNVANAVTKQIKERVDIIAHAGMAPGVNWKTEVNDLDYATRWIMG